MPSGSRDIHGAKPRDYSQVLTLDSLGDAWQEIRLSSQSLLVREPLDLMDFQGSLQDNLATLHSALQLQLYRPSPALVMRAAKRDGFTRPLVYPDVVDLVVLKTIVDTIRPELHCDLEEDVEGAWARTKTLQDGQWDYETWFEAWLRHSRKMDGILADSLASYLVKIDVANFFSTIDRRRLWRVLAETTSVDTRLLDLLCYVLKSIAERPDSADRDEGIPQDSCDVSKTLAHAFLKPLDDEFKQEIKEHRYTRWLDDIIVRVDSRQEGLRVLLRAQKALEDLGLRINAGKSGIVSVNGYLASLCPEENAYLDWVHATTDAGHRAPRPAAAAVESHIKQFLTRDPADRPATWDRVLKRCYTEARRMGSSVLETRAVKHIIECPTAARQILDYLRGRPYQSSVLDHLLRYLQSGDNLYPDVEILIYEFLLEWRISAEAGLWLARSAASRIDDATRSLPFLTEHARGLCTLLIYKYGDPTSIDKVADYYLSATRDPDAARYAVSVLAGTDKYRQQGFSLANRYEDRRIRRIRGFLLECIERPHDLWQILTGQIWPAWRRNPDYNFLPARMLPLVHILSSQYSFRQEWGQHLARVADELRKTAPGMTDERSLQIVQAELIRPQSNIASPSGA